MKLLHPALVAVLAGSSFAHAADAFPWDGTVTLKDPRGQALTWTVQRADGEVRITGTHPKWKVEHRSKPDGTPLTTVKRAGGNTTRVTYTADGCTIERTDAKGEKSTATAKEKGLWDADTLDARLAGLPWANGKKHRFKVIDIDTADGSVYPMVAEYVAEAQCKGEKCHHVRLALDDFRRVFAPIFEFRYAVTPGARYLQHDGDGFVFVATEPAAAPADAGAK